MSTGAELSVIGAPVVGLGVIAGGVLVLAAGVVVVGGVALVGTANLCVAAGSYAAERMNERAKLCAAEYERYQQLRAQAYALTPRPKTAHPVSTAARGRERGALIASRSKPAYRFAQSAVSQIHPEASIATSIAQHLERELAEAQSRADEQLQQLERRAYLEAMLRLEAERLPAGATEAVRAALADGSVAALAAAVARIHTSLALATMGEAEQLRSALADLEAQVDGVAATAPEPMLRQELRDLQRAIGAARLTSDQGLLARDLERYEGQLEVLQSRCAARAGELRAAELTEVWGLLQAVEALFADLQALQQAGHLVIRQELVGALEEARGRHKELEEAPIISLQSLRQNTELLRVQLRGLQNEGALILNRFYQQRLAGEVEAALNELTAGEAAPFDRVSRDERADGTIALRGTRGDETLELRVRPDGRLKYEAFGYGDERCLGVVYQLLDRLADRNVMLGSVDPELTRQANVVTQVLAALHKLGGYAEHEIKVYEDASAVTIEAGNGFITEVDRDGRITVEEGGKVGESARLEEELRRPETHKEATYRINAQRTAARKRQRS